MDRHKIDVGQRVMVEGTVAAIDGEGWQITLHDGELPPIGTFYFSNAAGIHRTPPSCASCGVDMIERGPVFVCPNCLEGSGRS